MKPPAKSTESRLCESIDRLVELQRSMFMSMLDHQRKVLDRALSVAEWGLRAAEGEREFDRAAGRRVNPRTDPAAPYHENGTVPVPDIVTEPGRTSFD